MNRRGMLLAALLLAGCGEEGTRRALALIETPAIAATPPAPRSSAFAAELERALPVCHTLLVAAIVGETRVRIPSRMSAEQTARTAEICTAFLAGAQAHALLMAASQEPRPAEQAPALTPI